MIILSTVSRGIMAAAGSSGGGGEPDWNALLAKVGTGTPDATGFNPLTDITYLGAFRIPFLENGVTNSRQKRCLAFRPADGSNGSNGSVFFGGFGGFSEHQIPTLSTATTPASLPAATVLQNWFNCYAAAPHGSGGSGSDETSVGGWAKYIGGKLYISYYADYSSAPNTTNLLICNNPANLAGSSYQGLMALQGQDRLVRYTCEIPAAHRSKFSNDTHFSGIVTEVSIVARSSFGHSLYSWRPEDIAPSDLSATTNERIYFPPGDPHYWFDDDNSAVEDHYETLLGVSTSGGMETYVAIPPASRLTDLSGLALPSQSIRKHMIMYTTFCGCAFIPPGSDTVVFIGKNKGGKYGNGYKNYSLEFGTSGFKGDGFEPWSRHDHNNCFWSYNVNDVANAQAPDDVDYIEYKHFLQDIWKPGLDAWRADIISGDFDPATGRLYLLQDGIPFNEYEDQHIVSVYQVAAP